MIPALPADAAPPATRAERVQRFLQKRGGLRVGVFLALLVLMFAVNVSLGHAKWWLHFSREGTWAATIVITSAVVMWIGACTNGRFEGAIIDNRNRISLSKFQAMVWTILILSTLLTAASANVYWVRQRAPDMSVTARDCATSAQVAERNKTSARPARACAVHDAWNRAGQRVLWPGYEPAAAPTETDDDTSPPSVAADDGVGVPKDAAGPKEAAAHAVAPPPTGVAAAAAPADNPPRPPSPKGFAPLDINIPLELLLAMGIAAASFVATPLLLNLKSEEPGRAGDLAKTTERLGLEAGEADANGKVFVHTAADSASWTDMFRGDETGNAASADLGKIQQFLITLFLVFIYGGSVWSLFEQSPVIPSLPVLSERFVWLLGISHASYLAYKAAPHSRTATDDGPNTLNQPVG